MVIGCTAWHRDVAYDWMLNVCRHRKYFNEDIVRDLSTSTSVQAELEKEWQQMMDDRKEARIIFPTGNSRVTSALQ